MEAVQTAGAKVLHWEGEPVRAVRLEHGKWGHAVRLGRASETTSRRS